MLLASRPLLGAGLLLGVDGIARAQNSKNPSSPPQVTPAPAPVEFDKALLHGSTADIRRFERGNIALPGRYAADLLVNGAPAGRADITLRAVDGLDSAQPCFDQPLLDRINIDLSQLTPESSDRLSQAGACLSLPSLVAGATAAFDPGDQVLVVTVPQLALNRNPRGYVDPRYWDEGVTAGRLVYNANLYHSDSGGQSRTQGYVGLDAGLNIGAWRFRHIGSYNWDDHTGSHYQGIQTSLSRAIPSLRSQLVIGDAFTDGALFDSIGFRGVQLASDDRMYPESQRGYAPVIRGVASTNALVEIRQGGNLLYKTTVAPGAFEIDDLYPTGYGGDLELVVTEADGSIHVSRVPFASPVNAVRPGVTRFSVTAGRYRRQGLEGTPWLFQGTVQHGFSNALTGYGGVTLAQNYGAALAGLALNTRFGAFGLDLTYARTGLPAGTRDGASVRLSYSMVLTPTGTNIALAAYRYSSSGYLGLSEAMFALSTPKSGPPVFTLPVRARERIELGITQPLPGGWGDLYLTGSSLRDWGGDGRNTQFQLGYRNRYKRISYGFSAIREYDVGRRASDTRLMLTLTMPLGGGRRAPIATTTVQRSPSGEWNVQETIGGTLGRVNEFGYGIVVGHTAGGDGPSSTNLSANASYTSPYARFGASVSHGNDFTQESATISGGVIAYSGGLVFMPYPSETSAIVEARGAGGAQVMGSDVRLGRDGRVVVTTLRPFARNDVEIDPKGIPLNVELATTTQQVAPTAGAIVRLRFETRSAGRSAFLRLTGDDDAPVPFGAEVFAGEDTIAGTVAQDGRVILHGLGDRGELSVRWGEEAGQGCTVSYVLGPADKIARDAPPAIIESRCRPAATGQP